MLTLSLTVTQLDLKKRVVIMIDIANDKIESKDYKPEEDPKLFHSEKTGRGPLTDPEWTKKCEPVMTCYKLVYIEFKWFGLQSRVESFIAKTVHNLFIKFHRYIILAMWLYFSLDCHFLIIVTFASHRQLFCWTDHWYGMSIQDIRDLEAKTKEDLDVKRQDGSAVEIAAAE